MRFPALITAVLVVLTSVSLSAGADSYLMRHADISAEAVVFTYEGDLWSVPRAGGDARRLTRHDGIERYAKFSPDGRHLAFTGSYDGGRDVYVMEAGGGVPRRLTYHPARDRVLGWTADGSAVLFRSSRSSSPRGFNREELYTVSLEGGMPERLPVDRAGLAALSPDGTRLCYNRISREDRTWKRHKGGTAQDLWYGLLAAGDFRRLTDWEGTDNYPMWDESGLYFTSDRLHGTMNLFRIDPATGEATPLTEFRDYDVKYPSIGAGAIVFQYGEKLHELDLATGEVRLIPIRVASDRTMVWDARLDARTNIGSFRLSPAGERLLLEARGEILDIPVEEGRARNLTRSSLSREKNAVWSPDGETIALISDRSGEEELYLIDPQKQEQWLQLTSDGKGFLMPPTWSPDGRFLLYSDKTMALNLLEVETGEITLVDQGEYDDAWERWGIQDYVFSPDSNWIAYTKMEVSLYESVFLYDIASKTSHRVTSMMTNDWSPSFSPDGEYLYFLSGRSLSPVMGAIDQNHVFLDVVKPYLVVLEAGAPSPFAPKADAPGAGAEEEAEAEDEGDAETTALDVDGIERRVVGIPGVKRGNYFRLEAVEGGFLYLAKTEHEFLKYQNVTDTTGGELVLHHYNLGETKDATLISGISNYHLSADGKKLVYRAGPTIGVVGATASGKVGDGAVELGNVRFRIDRLEEFTQIFNEAWRIQRDWFYDPDMHGVDWAAIGEKYRRFVPYCGNRADLNYLIGEMIAELNVGHTYIFGGDRGERPERVPVGLIGAELDQPPGSGYHRIARIVPSDTFDPALASPLEALGCEVSEGDYLISIDGDRVTSGDNVYAFLEHKAGRAVEFGTSKTPDADGETICRTKALRSEAALRYRAWVEANRRYVAEASNGQLGYVHIPNMMQPGLIEFARSFYPQHHLEGLVIDERYNGGGFVGDMIIDRLERVLWAITQPREGKQLRNPERVFHGHLAVLINEDTGSNGEFFAYAIKARGLAPVIGKRTWGGVIGIEPHQDLVDGGGTTPPQFGLLALDGTWPVEGRGVEPDIEVDNPPAAALAGQDPQLDFAIELLLGKISEDPKEFVDTPAYPVKAK